MKIPTKMLNLDDLIGEIKELKSRISELEANKQGNVSVQSLFSGDFIVTSDSIITIKSPITNYNNLFVSTGQNGEMTWHEIVINCGRFPHKFSIGDTLTFIAPDDSFVPSCVSLHIVSETELKILGGNSVRIRNIAGIII